MDLYPTISAGADAPKSIQARRKPQRPVLVALVHDVLQRERFTHLVDLTEAVKARAARLRIPYTSGTVAEAIRSVAHGRPVLETDRPSRGTRDRQGETGVVSRAQAVRIVEELEQRTGRRLPRWTR